MDEELTLPFGDAGCETGDGASEVSAGAEARADSGAEAESVLSVSEVNRLAKGALEKISVAVQGEVSGLNTRYPYYVYLNLRDDGATLPVIVTRRIFDELDFEPAEGSCIVAEGTLSLFEKQGRYQLRVSAIRPFGEGALQRRIEMIKKKLQAEGLFDDARKKPLPSYPGRIGVITSPRGAAVRDVTATLARRFPPGRVFVRGVRVQGAGAVEQICAALHLFNFDFPVDLVILARGGGSIEDLEAFSTEEVARAIARMKVPVVTGIGHEPDVSIADLVADRRGSTPTAAAEAAVPDRSHVTALLGGAAGSMRRHVSRDFGEASRRLASCRRLPLYRGSEFMLGRFMQRWERMAADLPQSPRKGLERGRHRLRVVTSNPVFRRPEEKSQRFRSELSAAGSAARLAIARDIEARKGNVARLEEKSHALSPLAVLQRGYSITFDRRTGAVVRSSAEVERGAALNIKLASGNLEAEVTEKE